jgi:sensor domain CHASE-containing protein
MRRFVLPSNKQSGAPAWLVFIVCLLAGIAIVAWRAQTRSTTAKARARLEAAVCLNALESQLRQGIDAVEILGTLAKQNGGNLSSFQQLAAEVLAAHPAVATLEMQPNGVVVDVVPRTGNEKLIGFNAITDPVQGPGAYAATQVRAITVAGPLALAHGTEAFVVRYPLFERGRDGRDYFRGFVAASIRLQDLLNRAGFTELGAHGYEYLLFIPGSAQHKGTTVVGSGAVTTQDAVPQTVRAQNLEFRLALRPPSGWIGKMRLFVEFAGVVVLSALLASLVGLMGARGSAESAVAEVNARLTRESGTQKQAQEETRRAKEELAATQTKLKEEHAALVGAEAKVRELHVTLDATVSEARNSAESAQARLGQAESKAAELQKQLVAAVEEKNEAVRAAKKESKSLEETLRQSQAKVAELQARVDDAANSNKESDSAENKRLEEAEATITNLKEQLKTATRTAKESADESVAKLKEAEALNTELQSRLAAAEQVKADVSDTNTTVDEPPKLAPSEPMPAEPSVPAEAEPVTGSEPTPESKEAPVEVAVGPKVEADEKPAKAPKRKKGKRDNQMDLFAGPPPAEEGAKEAGPKSEPAATPAPVKKLPPSPPVDPPELRKAVGLIMPLLTEEDPGAKDCLKDNLKTFRSAFTPEGYAAFAELIQKGKFGAARDELTKAAKKHGIPA